MAPAPSGAPDRTGPLPLVKAPTGVAGLVDEAGATGRHVTLARGPRGKGVTRSDAGPRSF